jgi:iron(III) transport system substrate-binding protein
VGVVAVLAGVSVGMAGCGTGPQAPATGAAPGAAPDQSLVGQTITVYSGQHEQAASALAAGFTAATGIKVRLRSGDEAELANQLPQEAAAGASPADVFYAENPPALRALAEKNLLAPVEPSTLAKVAAERKSPHGRWVGEFLAYLVDRPAATIIATSDSYEYPLGSGVSTAQPPRPLDQLRPPALTVDDLGDGRASLALPQQNGML